ncbi:MAG: DUF1236 domain-containing protein [Rhodoplanes sp.]|uniref:DUF1236 domain-containing protein n=1 Tax=Rhodoplanes sp. TaxID=1968906 RepID=UPI0017DA502B|nr:DUF1236 domain-containing protein [Rhodoplanes sp.]NVO17263.1 DUF1236 domain-containing protein [Rhodoplanes sp.]
MAALTLAGTLAALATAAHAQQNPPLPAMPSTGGVSTLSSQPVALTEDQKRAVARAVAQAGRKVAVPPGVDARVGAELPASMELYMLPDVALADIPEAKPYRYTIVENRVVLVDPTNMRVVEVLEK